MTTGNKQHKLNKDAPRIGEHSSYLMKTNRGNKNV